jgi:hypothetical protein
MKGVSTMSIMEIDSLAAAAPPRRSFQFRATDVTGSVELDVADVQRQTPAGAVAQSLAQRMDLPLNVPWALRDDRGTFLDDDKEIGDQVEANAQLTLTPKTHLG